MSPTLLIMAAGLGSRYGGLKQIDAVGPSGETLLEYAVYDAIRAGYGKIVFIIQEFFARKFQNQVAAKFSSRIPVEYAYQTLNQLPDGFTVPAGRQKPWGTAHATLAARPYIHEPFVSINADDFYGKFSFQIMADYLQSIKPDSIDYAMVGYQLQNTLSPHGTVNRGICQVKNGFLQTTIEHINISTDDLAPTLSPDRRGELFPIERDSANLNKHSSNLQGGVFTGHEIVSMNFWGFTPQIFPQIETQFKTFLNNINHPLKQEFYIPDTVSTLIKNDQATVKVIPSRDHWFGITHKEDKNHVQSQIQALVNQGIYPQNLWSKIWYHNSNDET